MESVVPAIGQGTSHLAEGHNPAEVEKEALRIGIDLGMTLIDTAEIYGSEELVGNAIAYRRDRVFLVSKIWPSHVGRMQEHCEASLRRLGTDRLDLYLLHWPDGINDFAPVVDGFEKLVESGKILSWGVSNFSLDQMEKLFRAGGNNCMVNQVLYNLQTREIEKDLDVYALWGMPLIAYSPLGGPGANILKHPKLNEIALAHSCSPAAVALSWTVRSGRVVAIPKMGSVAHVRENAQALHLQLTEDEHGQLSATG